MSVPAETVNLIRDVIVSSEPGASTERLLLIFPGIHRRRFAEAVEKMIERGEPIGSSPARGYFLCRTREDWDEGRGEILSRIVALRRRLDRLDAAALAAGLDGNGDLFASPAERRSFEGLDNMGHIGTSSAR